MAKKSPAKKKEANVKEIWIEVSDSMKLRLEVSEFKGIHRVDIREYIETEKYTGFTKKGVNVPTEFLEELHKGLGVLLDTVKKEELFNEPEEEVGA